MKAVAGAIAVFATICVWPATSSAVGLTTLSFTPVADTFVDSGKSTLSFGSADAMSVDGSPIKQGFMRFDVNGLAGRRVVSARLRLQQQDSSAVGGTLSAMTDNGWSEHITWRSRPAIDGPLLATFGPVKTGVVYEVGLGAAVTGDGPVSLALTSSASDGVRWSSRESVGAAPELVLEVEGASPVVDGLSQVAAPTVGSSDPTYYTSQKRMAVTQEGRLLTVHGRHASGVQLAWQDPGASAWKTASTGRVADGLVLGGTATGDWPASIALERDAAGTEHAWVVWSAENYLTSRPLQLVRLSDLDAPLGPSVGPIVTLEAPPLGVQRPDIGFERGVDGVTRGIVSWQRKVGDTTFEIVTAWLDSLETDTPALIDGAVLDVGTSARGASTLIGNNGVRALTRTAAGYLTVMGHETGTPGSSWWTGLRGIKSAGYPSATSLESGEILAAAETDQTNRIVQVQRFTGGGVPAPAELRLVGYRDPSIASDGVRAWVVMVRISDGYVVSREYAPATGWSSVDRVEIGPEGGGGHLFPNVLRRSHDRLRFVVRGPSGGSTGSRSAVLAFQRLF